MDQANYARSNEETAITTWRWIDTLSKQFELSDIGAQDIAVILSDSSTDDRLTLACVAALERLGAVCTSINVSTPRQDHLLTANPALGAAIEASDIVVNLSQMALATDPELPQLLNGALLQVNVADPELLDVLNPHPGLQQRCERARGFLTRGLTLQATSIAGTNVTVNLRSARTGSSTGSLAEQGQIDAWPAGRVWAVPGIDTVSGTVVIMPGDIIWESRTFMRSPVVLTLEKDHIADIEGDSGDADLLRSLLEAQDTPDAYGLASVGWGLNLTHRPIGTHAFDELHLSDAEGPLAAGTLNLTFGSNELADRVSSSTVTACLRQCTIDIDDVEMTHLGALQGSLAPDIYERLG